MKTERRHELETNQLANSLGHWADAVRPYTNTILISILLVVVGTAVFAVAQRRTAAGTAAAWDEYFAALSRVDRLKLEDLGDIHAGTPVGWWSLCMAAELGLNEGSNVLFRDKVLARDILDRAADRYQQVLGETRDPALVKQASFGLARVHECLGEIKKAEEEYQAIASKWHDTPVAIDAEQRLKDLQRPETKEFYEWFAKQDIGRRISPNPGKPGLKSPFNLNLLPDSPDAPAASPADGAAPAAGTTSDAPGAVSSEAPSGGPSSEATPTGAAPTGAKDAERQK